MENQEVKTNKKSGLAIAALVLSIIGIVFSLIPIIRFIAYPLGILALIFAIIPLCQKKSVAISIASLVLAAATLVLTFCLQAATVKAVDTVVKETSSSLDTVVKETSSSLDNLNGKNTEDILKNDLDVKLGKFTIEKGDFIDKYKLPVTIKNKSDKKCSFLIDIEAVDKNGKRIDNDTIYVDDLNAGQEQDFETFTLVTSEKAEKLSNATFKVLEVSKY